MSEQGSTKAQSDNSTVLIKKDGYFVKSQIGFVMQVVSSQLLLTHAACVWTDSSAQPQRRLLTQCESPLMRPKFLRVVSVTQLDFAAAI